MLNIIIPLQLNVKLVQLDAPLVLQVMSVQYAIRPKDMPFQVPLVLFAHQLNSSTSAQKPVRRVRGTNRVSPPVFPVHLTAITAMQTGALNVKLVLILILPTSASNVLLHSFSIKHPKLANHVAMLNIIIPLQLNVKLVQLVAPLVLQVMSVQYAIRPNLLCSLLIRSIPQPQHKSLLDVQIECHLLCFLFIFNCDANGCT